MKTETVEEFLKRGGSIKKVSFEDSYKKLSDQNFKFPKKKKVKN